MKVTFDKNVYEFVVDPDKPGRISEEVRSNYRRIKSLIFSGVILPFISETILTYEVIAKADRKKVLSNPNPIIVTSGNGQISISSNPTIHPGNTQYEDMYLIEAINLGFKILPDRRFGKLINPSIKSEWYYHPYEDYFAISEKFSAVLSELDDLNVGYKAYKNLLYDQDTDTVLPFEAMIKYTGSTKKLSAALSERSDGDSVALHIANELDYFCTLDKASNTKQSVFSNNVCLALNSKFSFKKGSPAELLKHLNEKAQ